MITLSEILKEGAILRDWNKRPLKDIIYFSSQFKPKNMFANFNITHISEDVKKIAGKVAEWTKQIEMDLNLGVVKAAAAYIPEGEPAREAIIAALEMVIKGCTALSGVADSAGVKSRLQRAGSDITKLLHDNSKHTISYYIVSFEMVFNDLFGKE